jgi:hypothetical protein
MSYSNDCQTITLVTSDGRSFLFTGPAGLTLGDQIVDILIGPVTQLPDGCHWETFSSSQDTA